MPLPLPPSSLPTESDARRGRSPSVASARSTSVSHRLSSRSSSANSSSSSSEGSEGVESDFDFVVSRRDLVRKNLLQKQTQPSASATAVVRERTSAAWPERQAGLHALGLVTQLLPAAPYVRFADPAKALSEAKPAATLPDLDLVYVPTHVGPRAHRAAAHRPVQIGKDRRDATSAQRHLDAIERERVVATYDLILPVSKDLRPAVLPLVECFPHAPRTKVEEAVIFRWQKRPMKEISRLLFHPSQRLIRQGARTNMRKYGLLPRFVTLGDAEVLTDHPFDPQAYRERKLAAQQQATVAGFSPLLRTYADTPENREFMRQENEFLAAYTLATFHLDPGASWHAREPLALIAFPGLADDVAYSVR